MSGHTRFEKLLEPGYIGSVKTRNRIIKTGAGMLMWHKDDVHMREEVKAFYERMARGGVGLLIVESPTIDYPLGARWRQRYRIDDDKYIEGLGKLVEVVHKHGCPTLISEVKEYVEITGKGLTIINKEGERQVIEADTVLTVLPLTPNMGLVKSLKGKVSEVYGIGDCKEPHLIADAIGISLRTARAV
ncbi:MAG: hypothetical protein ABSB22_00170 [Thermodesulfobacteriota bacterium]|jgi:hypothetical protein